MINIGISKVYFPGNQPILAPIQADMYIRPYYGGSFALIQSAVDIRVDGTVNESPLPTASIDPAQKYVLRTVDTFCGDTYEQVLSFTPHCTLPYVLSGDKSYCFIEQTVAPVAPSAGVNTAAATNATYSSCGTVIVNPGYNLDGTGSSTLISLSNPYWRNGSILCGNNNLVDGPLNRSGLWAASGSPSQIGFSVCLDIPVSKTLYVGMACDNFGTIRLDGTNIVNQNPATLNVQYSDTGSCFKYWFIYPVAVETGLHILELIGNDTGGAAGFGCAIYSNTPSEIAAATSDADLTFVFDSKNYIGMPVVLGSDNVGYSCPTGYALQVCESPFLCRKIIKIPISF